MASDSERPGFSAKNKKIVLDATAFLESDGLFPKIKNADLMTVPEVIEEAGSKLALIADVPAPPLSVRSPAKKFLLEVQDAVNSTGDALSDADERVIALAIQEKGTVLSDDYGVQNVCRHMGMGFLPMSREGIKAEWRYVYRCRGCGRIFDRKTLICPVCGHEVRKVRKK